MLNIIRKIQIKSKGNLTKHQLEGLESEKLTIPSTDKDVEELELSHTAGGSSKWYNRFGNSATVS